MKESHGKDYTDVSLRLFSTIFSHLQSEIEGAPQEMRRSLIASLAHMYRANGPMEKSS